MGIQLPDYNFQQTKTVKKSHLFLLVVGGFILIALGYLIYNGVFSGRYVNDVAISNEQNTNLCGDGTYLCEQISVSFFNLRPQDINKMALSLGLRVIEHSPLVDFPFYISPPKYSAEEIVTLLNDEPFIKSCEREILRNDLIMCDLTSDTVESDVREIVKKYNGDIFLVEEPTSLFFNFINTYKIAVPLGEEQYWIDYFKSLSEVRYADFVRPSLIPAKN